METLQLRVTGLCEGNSPVTSEIPQRAINAENVSILWHHHDTQTDTSYFRGNLNAIMYLIGKLNIYNVHDIDRKYFIFGMGIAPWEKVCRV